jgi:hypothetical protein
MWKDRSSFSTCKTLSHPKVIERGDDNSVTTTHYVFINIIQVYHVRALRTPTFRLSLLLINQLDLGGHMTIFQGGKCSITSPSSSTLAGKLVNGIYIIVPATVLLSSTTESGKKRNKDSSRPSTIQSSEIAPTSPPASSVLKSRLWHRLLAYLNPTAINSIVKKYTHDDSMYTVCIQAKHKQRFIKVSVKRTTKHFVLVHSAVCCPFSTPTLGDNRYYILFIEGYTRYTSVLLFPNKKAETCTSAYQSFQARVDSMGYEIKRFRCGNGQGEYDIKSFRYVLAVQHTSHALQTLTIRNVFPTA